MKRVDDHGRVEWEGRYQAVPKMLYAFTSALQAEIGSFASAEALRAVGDYVDRLERDNAELRARLADKEGQ